MKQISTYSKMKAHLLTHTHISRITLYAAFLFIGLLCSVGEAWGATTAKVNDVLWKEAFTGTTTETGAFSASSASDIAAAANSSKGTSMLDNDDISGLSYTASNVMLSSASGANCVGAHIWLKKETDGVYFQVTGIPLYGATKIRIIWNQGGGSSVTAQYKLDSGDWTDGKSTSSAGADITSDEISTSGKTTLALKFTRTNTKTNVRLDSLRVIVTAVPAAVAHTVTLMDNSATLTEASPGAGVTLPSRSGCSGYTFAGWTKTWVAEQSSWTTTAPTIIPAGSYSPSANENLYPVYTKTEGGGSATASSSTITAATTSAVTLETGKPITYKCSSSNEYGDPARIYKNSTITIAGATITAISLTGVSGYAISNMTASSGTLSTSGDNGSWSGSASSIVFTASTAQARVDAISVTYTVPLTTSYISVPNCCTSLGSINGSVKWSNPTEAKIGWHKIANVASWTLKYREHGDGDWTTAWSTKVPGTDAEISITDKSGSSPGSNDSCYATITGLSCNTTYDFQLSATASSSYCDKDTTMDNSGSGYNSGKWSVEYNLTNVSKTSGPNAGANVCGDFSATFEAAAGSALPNSITVVGASSYTWTKATGSLSISGANITGNLTITIEGVCTAFSFHTGNHSYGGWVTNNCFDDADWGASDDAIWEGEFPTTNAYYVGWQGSTSTYGEEWAIGGIKTYDIPTGRALGWNSGNYYESYPANALGTFHIYKNSTDKNYYLRFKPEAYVLRTGTDGTSWTSTAMTKSASNNHYYETDFVTLTSTLINEHAYVALKANNANGYVWCNFSSDAVAEGNVKVKDSPGDADGNFRGSDLADGDAGKYGKFRIDITKDASNWKLAFVPFYRVTYNGSGASGSTDASAYVEKGSTISAATNGFTVPTGKSFAGWATSADNAAAGTVAYAAGASVTVNADTELFAVWSWIDYTVTVNQSPSVGSTLTGSTSTAHYGGPISISATVPDGYSFAGWTTSDGVTFADATSNSTSFTMPAKDVTVQANFKRIHTVTWYVNGSSYSTGVMTGNTKVIDGEKISDVPTAPDDETLNNCANKFMGWSATNITKGSPVTDADDIEALALFTDKAGSPTISDDTDFYAVFAEDNSETDIINNAATSGNIGTAADNSWTTFTITGSSGAQYTIYSLGLNNGSHALQWNNKGYLYCGTAPTSGNKLASVKITTTANKSIGVYGSTTAYSAKPTATSLTTLSATSSGTSYDISSTYGYLGLLGTESSTSITEIRITYGGYENYVTQCADNQVRVTYDFNGGTGTACTEGVTTKTASYTVCSTEPEKDYYDFAGWNDGTSTYSAGATYNLQATTEFTAQWTPTTYTITYVLNDGTNDEDNPATYTVETSDITLKDATKGHSRFDGWFTDNGVWSEEVTTISNGSHGNITLYAKWTDRNEIKFYADDDLLETIYRASDENLQASIDGQGSKPSDPSAPSACSSKVFKGWTETWFNDETDTEPADLNDATGTRSADKTYYAVWATQSGSVGSYTYSAYSTTCCGKSVEVDGGSPSNGTVTFDKSYAWTCKGDREIVMTITPATGYQLHTFSVATGDGKVAAKSMSADVALDNNSSAAQVITLTFAKDADGAYDVTATFAEMTVTSWEWTYNSSALPDPIDVYVGQKKQIDVVMSPSGVLSSHKNNNSYTHSVNATYIANPNRAGAYFTFEGKAATESTPITLTHNDDTSEPKAFALTFNVRVKALPLVHFVDNIHNESFSDVVATVSVDKMTVNMVQSTPTHADVDVPGSGNSCEKTHLHLIGWIRSDYSKVAAYMEGIGDAPTTDELRNAGSGYWFTPNADINVETYNGKTFYAVWAVEE